jgi:hypothetical protein
MFSTHLTKLTMNASRFYVSCIQETDYRPRFTCGGLLDCKHTGQRVNAVRLSANGAHAFPKVHQTARMRIIVTAVLQRQYLQTELILWKRLVDSYTASLPLQ